MKNLRIIFFGTPDFVLPVLEELSKNFNVVGVVTTPDKKIGRKQLLTPSPIKLATKGQAFKGCPFIFTPDKLDGTFAQELKKLNPDLLVVAAYGHLIPQFILEIPKFGALNIHPSLLPKYRGPSPIQAAILSGDQVSGVTIILMDEKMDHGPVVTAKEIRLSEKDTFDTLSKKMFEEGSKLLTQIIPDFVEGKVDLNEQDHPQAIFTHIIKKEEGYFDLPDDNQISPEFIEKLDKMIRAYYPWPNVWTRWNGKIIKFYPGEIIQTEGKKPTTLENFLNGYPNFPIKSLKKA